jgi:hypothetical protein
VIKLEKMARQGSLHAGAELFLFTDNFVIAHLDHHMFCLSHVLYG